MMCGFACACAAREREEDGSCVIDVGGAGCTGAELHCSATKQAENSRVQSVCTNKAERQYRVHHDELASRFVIDLRDHQQDGDGVTSARAHQSEPEFEAYLAYT